MVRVSVLLPVYNAENYIAEAIDSIFEQTLEDFELIVIDDASTDKTIEILNSFQDERLQLHLSHENRMHAYRLNQGIDLAKGNYLAIMHGDDVAHPKRLERQVEFLDSNPDVGVCGTWYRAFGAQERIIQPPVEDKDIRLEHLLNNSALGHPTVMLRHSVVRKSGLRYESDCVPAEDYWYWAKLSQVTRFANVSEVLLSYRIHSEQIGQQKVNKQLAEAQKVRDFLASLVIGRELTPEEKWANYSLHRCAVVENSTSILILRDFVSALLQHNKVTKVLEQSSLAWALHKHYRKILVQYARHHYLWRKSFNLSALAEFLKDPCSPSQHISWLDTLKFSTKCLLAYDR